MTPDVLWPGGPAPPYLTGIWGSSAEDIFAVGGPGAILHYDGESWRTMTSGTDLLLHAVGGSSPRNVYAVGESCTILHFDGTSWQPVLLPFDCRVPLRGVWVQPGSDVVFVGDAGTIIRGVR
jgi:hypothetical protein